MDHLRSVIDIEDHLRSSQRQSTQELERMHAVYNNSLSSWKLDHWHISLMSYLVTSRNCDILGIRVGMGKI